MTNELGHEAFGKRGRSFFKKEIEGCLSWVVKKLMYVMITVIITLNFVHI
jgi:hypothetical protein